MGRRHVAQSGSLPLFNIRPVNRASGPDRGGPFGPYKQVGLLTLLLYSHAYFTPQSERLELYRRYAAQLLNNGHAYRCFCSSIDLNVEPDPMLAPEMGEMLSTACDGACSHVPEEESADRASKGEKYCIRFEHVFNQKLLARDVTYGLLRRASAPEDFVILKSDGYPTYHFANVVDDHFMRITHVIRGAVSLSSRNLCRWS